MPARKSSTNPKTNNDIQVIADCLSGYSDASLSQEVFDVSVTEIESIVEPDSVTDDIRRESVAFRCIHPPSLPISRI